MSLTDYEKYKKEQETQGATMARIEKEYSTLPESHRELQDSLEKMNKREKKGINFSARYRRG